MDVAPLIAAAAQRYGFAPPLIAAQVEHESGSDPLAIGDGSWALGLMQVHRVAAEAVGKGVDWDSLNYAIQRDDEETAAELSLDIGCAYLASLMTRFSDLRWALAAYNQGPTVIGHAKFYAESILKAAGP